MRAKNAAEMVRSLRAMDAARQMYNDAFEVHATAEQLAVFWAEFSEADTHRVALDLVLRCGDQELNAKPLHEGAW